MATPGPDIEPLASTSRQTARRRAAQARVTRSLAGQRAAAGPPVQGAVQVQVALAATAGLQAAGAPGPGPRPARPSRMNTCAASRRAAARSSRSVAAARSASRAAAASGSAASSPASASCVEAADLRRDLASNDGCRRASSARPTVRRGSPPLRSRRRLERDWPGTASRSGAGRLAVSFSRPSARARPPARSSGGAARAARRPQLRRGSRPARTPGCGRSRRRSGSGRTGRRARRPGSCPRARPASPRSRCSPVSSSTRSIAPRTEEPIRTSRCSRVARVMVTARSTDRALDAGGRGGDGPLRGRVLVAEHDPADPVRDRVADPGRADRVERVHGGDQPEPRVGPHGAEPGHRDLALGQHGDQDVERLLGDPVELLEVEQGALPHGRQQRAVGEAGRRVPGREHLRRVVLPDQPGRRELGVALDEDHVPARRRGRWPAAAWTCRCPAGPRSPRAGLRPARP